MSDLSPASILYDANGNPVAIVNDGGVYRIAGLQKIQNVGGTQINPATQETLATRASEATLSAADTKLGTIDSVLDAIKDTSGIKKITDPLPAGTNNIGDVDVLSSALPTGAATEATLATRATEATLQSVDGKDFATETTLATRASEATLATRASEATLLAADGRLTTIDDVLDSIKDTDGIKKITDELPEGTNEIGSVAQGTKAAAEDGWPEYLVDTDGNAVSVGVDGNTHSVSTQDQRQIQLSKNILFQLKIMNMHLSQLSGCTGMVVFEKGEGDPE